MTLPDPLEAVSHLAGTGRPPLGYDLRYAAECPACGTGLAITLARPDSPDPEGAPLPMRCLCGVDLRLERTSPVGWQAPDEDEEDLLGELDHDEAGEHLLELGEALTAGGTLDALEARR